VLRRVRCPVLFVLASRGDDDPRRQGVDTAVAQLPAGTAVRWVEGIHDLPVQRPREVATAMEEFLAAVGV
jgi:hypothetical protein